MRAAAVLCLACACGRVSFTASARDADNDTDSAASDATSDATGDATQVACMPGLGICDLFDGPLDTSVWTAGGNVTIDTAVAHRGASSVRFTMPSLQANQQGGSYLEHSSVLVTGASELWIRAWLRMSTLPLSTNALELVTLQQSSGLGNFIFARSNDTELYSQFNMDNAATGVAPPVNTWFCVVWHVVLATNNTGSSNFTSDVMPSMAITNTVTQGAPAIDLFAIGPFYANNNIDVAQPSFDVWYDDVILDDQPLTCAD